MQNKTIWWLIGGLILAITSVNTLLALRSSNEIAGIQKSLTNTGEVMMLLDELYISVTLAESGQRGYLLTDNERFLAPYQEQLQKVHTSINNARAISSEIKGQQYRIEALIDLVHQQFAELSRTVEMAKGEKDLLAVHEVKVGNDVLSTRIAEAYRQAMQAESEFRESLYLDFSIAQHRADNTFYLSSALTFALLIAVFYLTRMNLKNELRHRTELEAQNDTLAQKVEERTFALKIYADELSRSNRELEEFAFVASHDLQEPLRKIQAFGDRLLNAQQQQLDETSLDYLARINKAAQRMSNLISDLLAFSRVTTRGKEFSSCDLNKTLALVLDDLEISIEESQAEVEQDSLPMIKADTTQMHQLLQNLLSNALKFKAADQPLKVEVRCQQTSGPALPGDESSLAWYRIDIRDTGIGFEQQYADKIFMPFQRLHGRNSYEGTGIGLAVCRRIVERHGGKISATSQPGKGSTFTILLPQDSSMVTIEGQK
ncbi:CHASE3 domain-containing protein [Bowmanella sp. Y26]|uniref:sensor histidine kinase n=1 Tax=Bowmanella yangjiangensis TaxID=2811230 RepID=UPI001BDBFC5C|nr:sensor histidine kinase [Bowmanella yangjiangensis]MBT1064421.1 CHASE3 domain-containing protein [Bowmanella yangjiangensis]